MNVLIKEGESFGCKLDITFLDKIEYNLLLKDALGQDNQPCES